MFAAVATSSAMPPVLGAVFFLGLLAAAFSSADSALASLTTAFCVDFLGLEGEGSTTTRTQVYVAFMAVILAVMFGIYQLQEETIISTLFTAAGYTYGPLLGLFALALTTNQLNLLLPLQDFIKKMVILVFLLIQYSNQWREQFLIEISPYRQEFGQKKFTT